MVRQPGIDRRAALVGAAAALVMHATPAAAAAFEIAAVERRFGGQLGVFVLDLPGGRHLSFRADERFKLQSTFKGLLAALVLADVDRGAEWLSATVPFGRDDLLPASPVTETAAAHCSMTVSQLCEAIMYRSDKHCREPADGAAWRSTPVNALSPIARRSRDPCR